MTHECFRESPLPYPSKPPQLTEFLMGSQPAKSTKKRTSLPSGAPAEHLTVGEMLQKPQIIEEENSHQQVDKKKGQPDYSAQKSGKKAK